MFLEVEVLGFPKKQVNFTPTSSEFPWNQLRSSSSCRCITSITFILCHQCQLLTILQASSALPCYSHETEAHTRHEIDQDKWFISSLLQFPKCSVSEVFEKIVILHLTLWWLKWMDDGLQLHFVLLLCLNFCHGRKFLVQEAFETRAKGNIFIIYSDLLWQKKKKKQIPLSQGNLFLGMRSVEASISGGTCWLRMYCTWWLHKRKKNSQAWPQKAINMSRIAGSD